MLKKYVWGIGKKRHRGAPPTFAKRRDLSSPSHYLKKIPGNAANPLNTAKSEKGHNFRVGLETGM